MSHLHTTADHAALMKGRDGGTISLSEVISLDEAPLRLMPAGSCSDLCIHRKYSVKDKKASTQTIVSTTCDRLLLQRVKNTVCLIGRLSEGYRSTLSVAGSRSVLSYLRTLEIQTYCVLIWIASMGQSRVQSLSLSLFHFSHLYNIEREFFKCVQWCNGASYNRKHHYRTSALPSDQSPSLAFMYVIHFYSRLYDRKDRERSPGGFNNLLRPRWLYLGNRFHL